MESIALFTSAAGRIAPKPFWIGAAVVYVAGFLTQFLLASPVTVRASAVPFAVAQCAIAWAWYALHAKRLRDAGRPIGSAVALSVLYALAIVLLVLVLIAVTMPASAGTPGEAPATDMFNVLLLFFLIGMVMGEPGLGVFGIIILAVLALVLVPFIIAIAFTIWVGTRPSALAEPPATLPVP